MIAYLVRMDTADGPPLYFDPKAARGFGGGGGIGGWTENKKTALAFATDLDAQTFIDGVLPRQAQGIRPEACQLEDRIG